MIVELGLTGQPLCDHNGAKVKAKLRCGFFDVDSEDCRQEYSVLHRKLQGFLDRSGLREQQWRLCIQCQGCGWKAKAVNAERMVAKAEAEECMDRWACLSSRFDVDLPLKPITRVSYDVSYSTPDGKEIFCNSKSPFARPRSEHERDGTAYSQKQTKRKALPQLQFHIWYWMMAFCHEGICEACGNLGLLDVVPVPQKRFATHQTMALGNTTKFAVPAIRCFSSNSFEKVSDPEQLTMCKYLRTKAPENHGLAWGFEKLYGKQLEPLENIVASAVHKFAALLPDLRIFKAKGITHSVFV